MPSLRLFEMVPRMVVRETKPALLGMGTKHPTLSRVLEDGTSAPWMLMRRNSVVLLVGVRG